jgi:hypothetical protein
VSVMKGFRTIIFNSIMLIVMILSQIGVFTPENAPDAAAVNAFLDSMDAVLVFALTVGNIILRFFTNTPALRKE